MKKNINLKKTLLVFLVLFALIIAADVLFFKDNTYEGHFIKMDTDITIKGEGYDMDLATRDILKAIDEIDFEMSAHNTDGKLYKLNTQKKAEFSEQTIKLLQLAEDVCDRSDGAFDIKIKPIIDAWGFGTDFPKKPSKEQIAAALDEKNNTKISYSENTVTLNTGKIDLGGIAKGYASDKAKEILEKYENIDYAVIDFGGNIFTYGQKPDGSKFKVGIDDGKDGVFATLETDSAFIITSGGYERYFEENGQKYHHIIDPKTGYPSNSGLISATIISDSGALGDALSTACFVLGVEKGALLVESYGAKAVFLDENKNVYTVGDVNIELTDNSYTLAQK